jgi:hypothetical protein
MIVKCATCGTHVLAAITVEATHAGQTQGFCAARCADPSARESLRELPELPRRLLVAVDGSGPSVRAVEYAATLALATEDAQMGSEYLHLIGLRAHSRIGSMLEEVPGG